jgi:hypothetical protein
VKSDESSAPGADEIELRTTPEDVEAQRCLARPTMSPEAYLRFLESFHVSPEELRRRKGPRGEPFRL